MEEHPSPGVSLAVRGRGGDRGFRRHLDRASARGHVRQVLSDRVDHQNLHGDGGHAPGRARQDRAGRARAELSACVQALGRGRRGERDHPPAAHAHRRLARRLLRRLRRGEDAVARYVEAIAEQPQLAARRGLVVQQLGVQHRGPGDRDGRRHGVRGSAARARARPPGSRRPTSSRTRSSPYRVAVGHERDEEKKTVPARPWAIDGHRIPPAG